MLCRDGQAPDFGALMSRMMPMMGQLMGAASGGSPPRGLPLAATGGARAQSTPQAYDSRQGAAAGGLSQLQRELRSLLGDEGVAEEWARIMAGDWHQLPLATMAAATALSAAYRAGSTQPGSSNVCSLL